MQVVRICALGGGVVLMALGLGCGESSGDEDERIVLGDGVHGPQRVPAGSTLESDNTGGASIESNEPGAAVIVDTEPGKTTTVRGVNVFASGGAGILVRGGGTFVGEDLDVRCGVGVCIAAEGLTKVVLKRADVGGTITHDIVPNLVFPLKADQAPIVGVALSAIGRAELSDVSVHGFGGFGAIVLASNVVWQGGGVRQNVGVGVIQHGGDMTLTDVVVSETWAGEIGSAISAFGLVLTAQGLLHTTGLSVMNNEGHGVVLDASRSDHAGLVVSDNGNVGLWLQNASGTALEPSLLVSGTGNVLERNAGGGLFAIQSGGIDINGVRAASAVPKQIAADETTLAEMADGIQVAELTGDIRLSGIELADNQRVGLLLSGPVPPAATVVFESIAISGAGDYGLIAQDSFVVPNPGSIQRTPELEAKDDLLTGSVPKAASKTAFVSVATIEDRGLIGAGSIVAPDGSASATGAVTKDGLTY